MTPVLVDTGFLVALLDPSDRLSKSAASYIRNHRHPLATTAAAVVETCFFLDAAQKVDFLAWLRKGAVKVHEVPVPAYAQIELTLRKYSEHEINFADAALVWLAGELGVRRILTADRHFELFRLAGGKRFELVTWY